MSAQIDTSSLTHGLTMWTPDNNDYVKSNGCTKP
jgi:hypothetical protein